MSNKLRGELGRGRGARGGAGGPSARRSAGLARSPGVETGRAAGPAKAGPAGLASGPAHRDRLAAGNYRRRWRRGLAGWSLWMGRQDLWVFAAPTALAGQVLLLIGLVLQLHRLGRNSRHAAGKLDRLDQEIHESANGHHAAWARRTARRPRPFTPIWPTAPARRSCSAI